jgi:hypothetical protein
MKTKAQFTQGAPFRTLLAASLMWLAAPAHALSCVGVSDRFFVKCSESQCAVTFRARDVPAPGACARRTLVESPTPETSSVVLNRVSNEVSSGMYEVTLVHRYYGKPPVSGEELAGAFNAHVLRAPRVTVRQLAADTNLDELRDEWTSSAHRSMLKLVGYWSIEVLLLAAGLFAVYRTTSNYRKRLRGVLPGRLATPVGVQVGLFVLAVLSLSDPMWPILIVFVVPILLVVWLYELTMYLILRFRRKASNHL